MPMCLVKRQEVSRRRREWGKGTSEVRRVGKKMSGEKMCQVSGSRAVNSKDCQNSKMTSANRIERSGIRQGWQEKERHVRENHSKR